MIDQECKHKLDPITKLCVHCGMGKGEIYEALGKAMLADIKEHFGDLPPLNNLNGVMSLIDDEPEVVPDCVVVIDNA